VSFNIGSQQAGVINNVQGDQAIRGGQVVIITSSSDAQAVLRELRNEVHSLSLDVERPNEVVGRLDEMEQELQRPDPDRSRFGERLTRITQILTAADAFVSAENGLGAAITRLGEWLGPFGAAALRVLRI
jgi:hypothetical protein